MKKCELCDSPANMYCESDQASLCWDCDTRVHGVNFLVAKHTRTLLCHVCQAPTPWNGSGPKLGPTISVCGVCVGTGTTNTSCNRELRRNNNELGLDRQDGHDHDDNEEEEEDDDDDSGDDDGGEDEQHADADADDDDDDEENQVVPWTSTPPPPVSSSSTSTEDGSSRLCNGEEGTSASNLTFSMNHTCDATITKFGSQEDHNHQQRYYSSGSQQHKNMYWWSHESPSDYRKFQGT